MHLWARQATHNSHQPCKYYRIHVCQMQRFPETLGIILVQSTASTVLNNLIQIKQIPVLPTVANEKQKANYVSKIHGSTLLNSFNI